MKAFKNILIFTGYFWVSFLIVFSFRACKDSLEEGPKDLSLQEQIRSLEKQLAQMKASMQDSSAEQPPQQFVKERYNKPAISQSEDDPLVDERISNEVTVLTRELGEIQALLQDKGIMPPVQKTLAVWTDGVLDPLVDSRERLAILRKLRSAGARSPEIVLSMVQLYREEPNARIRADIFRQLNGVTEAELLVPLIDAVADEIEPDVREEAAETLANFLPDPIVKEWLEYLRDNDSSEAVRRQAQASLTE